MEVAFIVKVNLDDVTPSVLIDEAETIKQDLFHSGLDVISVEPWQRPSLQLPTVIPQQQEQPTEL